MNYARAVKMIESRNKLSNEGPCGSFSESSFLEIVANVREKFSSIRYLSHKTVQITRLHRLIEPDDVWVVQSSH